MWGRSQRKILVLGNDPSTPGIRPRFLQKPDIRLLSAEPGSDVAALVRRHRPDLIIEDLPAPPEPGLDLCRSLKADPKTRPFPLILVADGGTRQRALQAGADVVLGKPIVQREYYEAVKRFVRLPKRRVLRHLVNLRFSYETEDGWGQAFSRDLSLYGAFLKTDRAIEQGRHINVHFNIPGQPAPIRCDAIVRRCNPYDPHAQHPAGFAIEFEGIAEPDLERLERFITRYAHRPLFSRLTE